MIRLGHHDQVGAQIRGDKKFEIWSKSDLVKKPLVVSLIAFDDVESPKLPCHVRLHVLTSGWSQEASLNLIFDRSNPHVN